MKTYIQKALLIPCIGMFAITGALSALAADAAKSALPDDGKTPETIETVPICKIDPPEQNFFTKRFAYRGLPIKSAEVVSDKAFYEAWRRIDNLLKKNPVILSNMVAAGAEVQIIGKDQGQTDLPDFRKDKGVPLRENPAMTLDERARGMGGLHCSCGEENLLKLPNDRYKGRDILSHEFTHTLHAYGVSQNIKDLIEKTYRSAREKKLWETPQGRAIYGGSNVHEYLAELALWYVGGRGDWPASMGAMQPGPEFIKKYDPDGYKLVDDLFNGRLDVQSAVAREHRRNRNSGA